MPLAVVKIRIRLTPPKRGCALQSTEAVLTIHARFYNTPASKSHRVFTTETRLWLPTARTRKAQTQLVIHLKPSHKKAIDVRMTVDMPRRGHGRTHATHVAKARY
jgi:hypothetical protein